MKRKFWTEEEIAQLTALYPDTRTAKIAEALGRGERQVYCKAQSLGLKKTEAYMASPDACRLRRGESIGQAHRFKAGHATWNKGMKGLNTGGTETRFKPGQLSGRAAEIAKPLGTYRVVDGVLKVKTSSAPGPRSQRWTSVHRLVWEAEHGPVPDGHFVRFREGMHTTEREQITLDRLELVTRAENMARNTVHNYPKEIAELCQLRGALTRKINARRKNDEQHD